MLARTGAWTLNFRLRERPIPLALMLWVVVVLTGIAVTVKADCAAPAGTVTDDGIETSDGVEVNWNTSLVVATPPIFR